MPEIAMCIGKECPKKNECYRYRAIPFEWQNYYLHSPFKNGKCRDFWPIDKNNKLRNVEEIEKDLNPEN